MSENPGGTPPRDGEATPAPGPQDEGSSEGTSQVPPPASDAASPPATTPDPAPETPDPVPATEPAAPPAPQAPAAPHAPPPAAGPGAAVPPLGSEAPLAGAAVPPSTAYPPPNDGRYDATAGPYGPGAVPPPPPPPPPSGPYAAPATAQTPIGEALSWGWTKFTQNGGVFVGAGFLWFVISLAVLALASLLFGGFASVLPTNPDGSVRGPMGFGFSLSLVLFGAFLWVVGSVVQAVFVRAALKATYGRRVGIGDFFDFSGFGRLVVAILLVAGINVVVSFVAWVPVIGTLLQLAVNIFLFFTLYFVIDKGLEAVDAVRSSVELVRANLGPTILFLLLCYAILLAGALACGIGLVVAVPVVLLAAAYFYRRLLGEPIAP